MSTPSDKIAGPLLLDFASVTALITALMYFTGGTYAYHYFGHFKLSLLTLEIPTEYFFVYGFWVFKTWWWLVILYGIGIVLLAFYEPHLAPWLDRLSTERHRLLKQLQVLVVLVAFLLAWRLASVSAEWYYQEAEGQRLFVLYHNLFGKLDDKLERYDTLYIAPDGFLSLLAFAELVTPDGQYWVQRQTLRQVATGRHLIADYDRDLDKPKGLLALGGVDYEGFGAAKPAPRHKPKQPDQNLVVATCAVSTEIGRFSELKETSYKNRVRVVKFAGGWLFFCHEENILINAACVFRFISF
jgi:hypothetical protein